MKTSNPSGDAGGNGTANDSPWPTLLGLARDIVADRLQASLRPGALASCGELEEDERWGLLEPLLPEPAAMGYAEKVVVLLAMTPHLQPGFWESMILQFSPGGGDFPELGGVKGNQHRGMLPTGETAQFILAGTDTAARLGLHRLFDARHVFARTQLLWLEEVRESEPAMSGRLMVSQEWMEVALLGRAASPRFGADFPAKLVSTRMTWADLVLHPVTVERLGDIKRWLTHRGALARDAVLSRRIQTGYRVLFHGPPGTGKTLTAALIGKEFEMDVYRVDLSLIVSKYIGETEKNLGRIFDRAQDKDWILFFDEADSLFGKRTNVQSSHDKFANQEVSFLLQRVEDFSGLMILASNYKNNIDDAFMRRFHSVIHFPMPGAEQRLRLWQQCMPETIGAAPDVNLRRIAEAHEVTGASIVNVVQHAALRALARPEGRILQEDILAEIARELRKEDRSM